MFLDSEKKKSVCCLDAGYTCGNRHVSCGKLIEGYPREGFQGVSWGSGGAARATEIRRGVNSGRGLLNNVEQRVVDEIEAGPRNLHRGDWLYIAPRLLFQFRGNRHTGWGPDSSLFRLRVHISFQPYVHGRRV